MTRIITLTPNPTYDFAVDSDFVEPNRKLRCKNPQTHPGGGGVNVARAASRLGAETLAILTVGGVYGQAVEALIAAEAIAMRAIPVAGETRVAFHVSDRTTGDEYRFNLPGAGMSAAECGGVLTALAEETRAGDYVVGSGSLPPMRDDGPSTDFWARAARTAKAKGARFVLDSISGLRAAMAEGVFLLRQNEHEYRALAGRALRWPDEVSAFACKLAAEGVAERIVISHGADGSVMAMKSGSVFAPALKVKARSAVGAGDSFVAALIVALTRGWSDQEALRYAAAAAAATRMSPGTALFDADDVDRLFRSPV